MAPARTEGMEALPTFRYHPDPLASGSVALRRRKCRCCGRVRGAVYEGPVYAEEDLDGRLCPWCIADGSAAARFDASFVDDEDLEEGIPAAAARELGERTPGFAAWDRGLWLACCGDATAFVGPAGIAEVRAGCREVEGMLMSDLVHRLGISGGLAVRTLEALTRGGSPTVMLFRCLACRSARGYVDALRGAGGPGC